MNKRLLSSLSVASIVCAALLFLGPDVVLAQQSRTADSLKAPSSSRERGRSSAREAGSQRARDASSSTPSSRRDHDAVRTRSSRPAGPGRADKGRTEARSDEGRRPTDRASTRPDRARTGRDARRDDAGAGARNPDEGRNGRQSTDATDDRRRNSDAEGRGRNGRGSDDNERGRERQGAGEVDPRGDRDYDRRGDRGYDRRGDRESDRRGDRDYDRRGDRDYDRRGDRDYDRRGDRDGRRGGNQTIINRRPHGSSWARPRVHVDIHWPWIHRHERHWSPRYRYRQVVYVDAGWGRSRRESRLDLRTFYRHRVRDASARRAVVDIEIDRIEIYDDGFFVGEVRRIPDELARMRAVVDRRGGVRFDRDVFLLGDPYVGFEIISTRHYDGFVLNKYRRSHGVRAGALDLRRERVVPLRRSRFFDPRDFSGFVPINLLPEDAEWLVDYGYDSYSGYYWGDDDRYYYGFSDLDDYARFGGDRAMYNQTEPRGSTTGRETQSSRLVPERQALERSMDRTFETDAGARIRLKRESTIERVD